MKIFLKICTLSAIAFFLFSCTQKQESLSWKNLSNSNLKDLEMSSTEEDEGKFSTGGKTDQFEIKIIERKESEQEARRLWQGLKSTVQSFYIERESPYPGVLTKNTGCPEKERPQQVSFKVDGQSWSEGFLLYANSRYIIGSCDENDRAWRLLSFVMYCQKSEKTYSVKLYKPYVKSDLNSDFGELKKIFESFVCLDSH